MSKFVIHWMEVKQTKAGQTKAMANLIDESGVETTDVTIWSDFPGFPNFRPGSDIEGDVVEKNVKGKIWKSIYASKGTARKNFEVIKTAVQQSTPIVKAMERKEQSIERAQDNKMAGIISSSTFRAANEHTIQWRQERLARGINTTTEEWQEEWKNARKWFDARFDEPFN